MARPPAERIVRVRKGPWTPEEDIMLVSYIQKHGPGNWRLVPKNAGLERCGKSCHLRWNNYLRPGIQRGNFTPEEDRIIIQQHAILGNRWVAIAAHLPSRTDNDIKKYWYTNLKKKIGKMNSSAASTTSGNSETTPLFNQEKKNVADDSEIPSLTSIEKWFLEDPSAPFPQINPAPSAPVPYPPHVSAPVPYPQVTHISVPAIFPHVPIVPNMTPGPSTAPRREVPVVQAMDPGPSTACRREGYDYMLNMFTLSGRGQMPFGPFDQ